MPLLCRGGHGEGELVPVLLVALLDQRRSVLHSAPLKLEWRGGGRRRCWYWHLHTEHCHQRFFFGGHSHPKPRSVDIVKQRINRSNFTDGSAQLKVIPRVRDRAKGGTKLSKKYFWNPHCHTRRKLGIKCKQSTVMHTSVQYIHKILIALLLFVFSERKKVPVPREHVPVSSSVLRDFRVTDNFFCFNVVYGIYWTVHRFDG